MMSTTLLRSKAADGTTYVEAGSGRPLVLIHGVGMRLEAWEPQIDALSRLCRVIAVDMPGHGDSPALRRGARLPDFVDWFGRFLDALGLSGVAVAGHSMGALIAGGAVATFGGRIDRVALLNGVYRRSPEARAAVVARARMIERGSVNLSAPLERWFSPSEVGGRTYGLVRDWLASVDVEGYSRAYAAFAEGDDVYADAWPDVACPALFLTGDLDLNSTPEMSREMAQATPRGEAVIIARERHVVHLTAPNIVNYALVAWLKR
jgi:pimeloyl-ACP methyl ester carboxylesterase